MYPIDLIRQYFPTDSEISPKDREAARNIVVDYLSNTHTDQNFAPGSVGGDLIVGPMTTFLVGTQIAMGRFMSDLDLENVANNVIYNCDFVKRYLGNFAVYAADTLQGNGVVRLTFSKNEEVTINRSTLFSFGGDATYRIATPTSTADTRILPTATAASAGSNDIVLTPSGDSTFYADLHLLCSTKTDVEQGDDASVNTKIPNLVSVVALVDFTSGLASASLPALAEKTRTTSFSATPVSRNGIRAFAFSNWQDTAVISPVIPGDSEMQRNNADSLLAIQTPAVDIYYRSRNDFTSDELTINLKWDPTSGKFAGPVVFQSVPSSIWSVSLAAVSRENPTSSVLLSKSPGVDMPGVTAGYTNAVKYWMIIDPTFDSSGKDITPRIAIDDTGDKYGVFKLGYYFDPLFSTVSREFLSDDNRPIGVTTMVSTGPVVEIRSMTILHTREPGVRSVFNSAKDVVANYTNTVGYPKNLSESEIAHIVKKSGAESVQEVSIDGVLRWTAADRFLFDNVDFADIKLSELPKVSDYQTSEAYRVDLDAALKQYSYKAPTYPVTDLSVTSITKSHSEFVKDHDGATTTTANTHASGRRNVRYHIVPKNIRILEV